MNEARRGGDAGGRQIKGVCCSGPKAENTQGRRGDLQCRRRSRNHKSTRRHEIAEERHATRRQGHDDTAGPSLLQQKLDVRLVGRGREAFQAAESERASAVKNGIVRGETHLSGRGQRSGVGDVSEPLPIHTQRIEFDGCDHS